MAAVTVNSVFENVVGSWRERYYNVTGVNGSTLQTNFNEVVAANSDNPGVVTSFSYSALATGTPITVTFNTTGAFTNLKFRLTGK